MSILENLKKVLFSEDTISQETVVENMKSEIQNLKSEYNELESKQQAIKENPRIILGMEFSKKEKYIELMDHIKYKNIELIKEYEFSAMKYNILIELYKKLKDYISKIDTHILADFNTDKYKQPVAVLSLYQEQSPSIVLLKNTLHEEDYLKYTVKESIEIVDICSKEPNVSHGRFMVQMLFETAKYLKDKQEITSEKIQVSKDLINKQSKSNIAVFFKKMGFEEYEGGLIESQY